MIRDKWFAISSLVRLGVYIFSALVADRLISTYYSKTLAGATNALQKTYPPSLNLDMSFHKAHPPGEMISRIDSDVNTLNDFFSQFLLKLLGNFLMIFAILILLFVEDWRIGLALTGFSLVALVVLVRFRNIAVPHWEAERKAEADFYGFLEERLTVRISVPMAAGLTPSDSFLSTSRRCIAARLKLLYGEYSAEPCFLCLHWETPSLWVWEALYLQGVITIGTVYIVFQYNRMLEKPLLMKLPGS